MHADDDPDLIAPSPLQMIILSAAGEHTHGGGLMAYSTPAPPNLRLQEEV